MRKCLSRGDNASTGPDAGDLDTGRGCGRMVGIGIGSGVGDASMTQVEGLRTSKSPGVHASVASAAFAAIITQKAVSVVLLSSGNTSTEEPRRVNRRTVQV